MLRAIEENKGLVACQLEGTNTSAQLRAELDALLAPRQQG